tara:strand:- start:1698 stop:2423 length:726 start_codon:yes stop_codon:yes gene_type:complete
MTADQIEELRKGLQTSFDLLVNKINKIQIGNKAQFPFGWRKAAKGRTVWRILEELISQNLEKDFKEFKLDSVTPSDSEVSVHDFECQIEGNKTPIYVNIKSAVLDGKKNKDDISKGDGLEAFYAEDVNRNFFIGTFFIKFNDDMTIEIDHATVFPVAWIKDIYVNPSNNGNLQSAYYKDISDAVKRSNIEFHELFVEALEFARLKKSAKPGDIVQEPSGVYYKKIKGRWQEVDQTGDLFKD